MRTLKTLTLDEAQQIIHHINNEATHDNGAPVSIAVVGVDGELTAFAAMDDVMPASRQIAVNKAKTAIAGRRDTLYWEIKKEKFPAFDGRDFTDVNFTCFAGGVVILKNNSFVGAIGVSGRKSKREIESGRSQDHELAVNACTSFEHGEL
ncbi:MAG TPA: heme-binding protein [Candidatus Wolfebacteria bacterium]|nr:heme-binding protein [Candidatus Wolfebacteria bacterium]